MSSRRLGLVPLLAGLLALAPPPTRAATNSAFGGIGGLNNGTLAGGDGTGTARVEVNVTGLALVKQARDVGGGVLADRAGVIPGQTLYFVLLVDNPTPNPADNLQVQDLLDEAAFTYIPNTLQVATAPTGSSDAAVWAATWSPLSDAVGAPDDIGSITDTGGPPGGDRLTIGAVAGQANVPASVPGLSVRAIRFQVRVN
jgi:uncharacterized repeat protein (TIGR01451 family)